MKTTSTRSLYTSIVGLLLLLAPAGLFSEGFRAGTLVATPTGFCPIETLLPGDRVISRTKTGEETEATITAVSKRLTTQVRELIVDGQSTLVDKNQRFYVANKSAWCAVDKLSPGDVLVSPDDRKVCVEDVHECDKKLTTLYMLSVARHHNFRIGQSKLLAHNTGADFAAAGAPAAAQGGAAVAETAAKVALAALSSTGVVVSVPVALVAGGTAAVGYGVYSLVEHIKHRNHPEDKPPQDQNSHTSSSNNRKQQEQPEVRGFNTPPTAEEVSKAEAYNKESRTFILCDGQLKEVPRVNPGACLPETKPATTPTNHCPPAKDQIEKNRSPEPKNTHAALDPDKVPPCGRQGQTLPGLDSKGEAKGAADSSSASEQATGSQSPPEKSPAQVEAKHEPSNAAKAPATSPTSGSGSGSGTTQPTASSKPDYQADGYTAARLTEEISVVDTASPVEAKPINELEDLSDVLVKVEGKGHSKGRAEPGSHKEQLIMNGVMSNPDGKLLEDVVMTDKRWPSEDGWNKYAKNIDGVEIHYLYNERQQLYDDFKFKNKAPEEKKVPEEKDEN